MAAELEGDNYYYKLLLHHRDFPFNSRVAESVVNANSSSKRVITVLSNNFLENEWRQFKLRNSHCEILKNNRKRLIFILLDDISEMELDADIISYIKSSTYIYAGDKLFWRKLLFAMPDAPCSQQTVHTYCTIPELFHGKAVTNSPLDAISPLQVINPGLRHPPGSCNRTNGSGRWS